MRCSRTVGLIAGGALVLGVLQFGTAQAAVPAGFSDQLVANIGSPTAFAFTPDGRMLVTTKQGAVRVVQGGNLLATPAIDLVGAICSNSERGLLGIAVDPAFGSNGFVYLYYTFKKSGVCTMNSGTDPVNRVSRFVMAGNTLASETVLIDNIHSPNGNHNAGDLNFGKDGNLYVTVGDGGCDYTGSGGCAASNDASRDRNVLIGKVLRITRDGNIPSGNPFTGTGTARCNVTGSISAGNICQETFAWGLRNPFRFAFDPNAAGTVFHINDVGQATWEEIDLGLAGADYGWNLREGFCARGSTTNCGPPPVQSTGPLTNPIFAYGRSDGCVSITGGAFVPNGIWPSQFDGQYMFSDYGCGKIFRLVPNGSGGFNRVDFATGLGSSSAVHLRFGPHGATQALYYSTFASGGEIRRIVHTGGNTPPIASVTASPTSGGVPLTVNFNGSGSSDPDGDLPLTYEWAFGDGASTTTSTATTSHQYTTAGAYVASLVVRDSRGAPSQADTVTIQVGNTPPSPTITSPAAGARFRVGQTITLTGSATDAQDGAIPASRLTWTVLRHHNNHTHPWFGPQTGNNLTFQAPAPEDLAATNSSFLEIILTATDSQGASTTVTRNMQPRKVAITFATSPSGLRVVVNGVSLTGPTTITSWQSYVLNVTAPTPQGNYRWQRWSNGRPRTHSITTPAEPKTYTAYFRLVLG